MRNRVAAQRQMSICNQFGVDGPSPAPLLSRKFHPVRTPKQFLRDLVRPAAPPADEKPADFFPQVFFTPRALRDHEALTKKRGRQLCTLITRMKDGEPDSLVTPYGNLQPEFLARISCPEVACYIERKYLEQHAGYLIDHVPLPNDPPGTRTPNFAITLALPWPPGATASDPGLLRISMAKLGRMHPELMIDAAAMDAMGPILGAVYHMLLADANPALCVAIEPDLIVSAFSADIDCVVLLRFPSEIARQLVIEQNLKPGRRLISLNSYRDDEHMAADLKPGPKYSAWKNYNPYIAEFLADDTERLTKLHADMPDWAWQRCKELTVAAVKTKPVKCRDGRPLRSVNPAK